MNRSFEGFVLLAALLTFVPQALPEDRSGNHDELPPRINVLVHNYAQVSSEILAQAEVEAAEILGKAGIEIAWTNCDPTQKDLGDAAECNQFLGPTNLAVRILPYFGVIPGTDKKTMGFALGNLASVSVRRVSEEAAEFGVQPYEVLGPAIAHELGHILLGQKGHSPTGIMRAHWRREDYERAPRGAFNFTAEQAEQMRAKMNLSINVYVFNYAELLPKTLQPAEFVAATIFREAGIEIKWRDCTPALMDIDHDANCTQKASPTNLVLKILPDIAVTPGFTHDTTMGFAIGDFASVSFRQARKEAALMGSTADEILGLSAAHEIGHLLSQSHSDRGIMRPSWNREDFGVSPQGAFKFTPDQANQMRAEVATRGREQAEGDVMAKTAPK